MSGSSPPSLLALVLAACAALGCREGPGADDVPAPGGEVRLVDAAGAELVLLEAQQGRMALADVLEVLAAREINDPASERIRYYLERFRAAAPPDPERADWDAWVHLLGDRAGADGDPHNAMAIVTGGDYGTVCSSLVALPATGRPRMWFASGLPGEAPFETIAMTSPLEPKTSS